MAGYDGIDDALDTTSETLEVKPVKKQKPDRLTKSDVDKDYEYTRGQLYSIIEKGQETLDGVLELAQETNSPRAYEVAGQLIKNVSDATDKLLKLQKELKDLNAEDKKGPSHVTNNALIVGTTAELQKLIKQGLMDEKK
jgi:hypothetical protein|tara:strand:- start:3588 stop:4004 length:417 start_codon:yes stop_codon:yes gene_type:complete